MVSYSQTTDHQGILSILSNGEWASTGCLAVNGATLVTETERVFCGASLINIFHLSISRLSSLPEQIVASSSSSLKWALHCPVAKKQFLRLCSMFSADHWTTSKCDLHLVAETRPINYQQTTDLSPCPSAQTSGISSSVSASTLRRTDRLTVWTLCSNIHLVTIVLLWLVRVRPVECPLYYYCRKRKLIGARVTDQSQSGDCRVRNLYLQILWFGRPKTSHREL